MGLLIIKITQKKQTRQKAQQRYIIFSTQTKKGSGISLPFVKKMIVFISSQSVC